MRKRVHVVVRGRVQGVSFRATTADEARRRNLVGWVLNTAEGNVELEAEGEAQSIDDLVAWCKIGPPAARVDRVEVRPQQPKATETSFQVRWR
jgi:acylphosphatase